MDPRSFDYRAHRGLVWVVAGATLVAAVVMATRPKPVISRADAAKAAQVANGNPLPPEAALAPGEALVQPRAAGAAEPLMPHYTKPEPPPAAPTQPDQPVPPAAASAEARAELARSSLPDARTEAQAASAEAPAAAPPPAASVAPQAVAPIAPAAPQPAAPRAAPAPQPVQPNFVRDQMRPGSPMAAWSNPPASTYCAYCGEVTSVTVWPDMAEVRVRFQDGSIRTLRSGVPAQWHAGDMVRVEHGRLVRD